MADVTEAPAESGAPKAAATFGGMTPAEASRRRWEKQRERDAKGEGDARRTNRRSPLDALRDLMEADPDKYAAGLAKLVETGDPRSIAVIQGLFKVDEQARIPRAERLVRALDRDQRRALLLELEQRGATLPHDPDEHARMDA